MKKFESILKPDMVPFYDRCPKTAEKETRIISLFDEKTYGLRKGDYIFLESYCRRKLVDCDCRRVFLNVFYEGKFLATIGYGWEAVEFYKKWMGTSPFEYDSEFFEDMKGPTLEPTGYNSVQSEQILKLFERLLLPDMDYIERLKKHYNLFKSKT
ncbi:MAG: hypothetical protein ACYCSO_03290 [Cuniculiplasma sp.]